MEARHENDLHSLIHQAKAQVFFLSPVTARRRIVAAHNTYRRKTQHMPTANESIDGPRVDWKFRDKPDGYMSARNDFMSRASGGR